MHGPSTTMRVVRSVLAGAAAGLAIGRWRRRDTRAQRATLDAGASVRRGAGEPGEDEVPDAVLVERVRARAAVPLGVEVAMTDGAVVLFGRIARHALEPLLQRVARVEGVSAVENRLTPVDDPFVEPPA